jgi:hypothetical protein
LSHLILSAIFFHWPSQQFGPLAQFSLVIFDLQPRAAAFGLHDYSMGYLYHNTKNWFSTIKKMTEPNPSLRL